MTLIRSFFFCLCLAAGAALAQDEAQLRPDLERAYARWRSAVLAKDARAWAAAITMHRQIITRNLVISQGLPFPKAVFETMLSPADVTGLRLLEVQAVAIPRTCSTLAKWTWVMHPT
jgi:hypothetical protein